MQKGETVGVIGLGAGTLAAYGRKGDYYRFYEINPLVIDFARQQFTYVGDSDARVDLVLADGRSGLEEAQDLQHRRLRLRISRTPLNLGRRRGENVDCTGVFPARAEACRLPANAAPAAFVCRFLQQW